MMKLYSYCKDTYLVKGKVHSCIYDLHNGRLIHISKDYVELLDKIICKEMGDITLRESDNIKIKYLIDNQIIVESSSEMHNGNILQLQQQPYIKFAWIEVTDKCNLKCVHCYDDASIFNSSIMAFEEFKKVINELVGYKINKIQIIGGEPLVHPYIREMILYARPLMDSITIFTNAILLNREMVEFLKKNDILVAVSVYSYEPEQHDRVTRQKGSWEKTNRGIALLKEYGVKYKIANVLMKGLNIGEKNTDLYTLNPKKDVVRISGRASTNLLDANCIKLKCIVPDTFKHKLVKEAVINKVSGHNCFANKIYIAADLNVYPCVMERRISHGNLMSNHLNEIIKMDILKYSKDNISGCKECEFRYACFDCRPNSITGNINEKPWYCTYNPSEGSWGTISEIIDKVINSIK